MKTEELHNERNLFIDIGTEHSSASGKRWEIQASVPVSGNIQF